MPKSISLIELKALAHSVFESELSHAYDAVYVYNPVYSSVQTSEIESIKFLFVLKDNDPAVLVNLKKCHGQLIKKTRGACELSYQVFSSETLSSSLDIFPIEFLELSSDRDLLLGSDILTDIRIDPKNLRQECEFYLRTHLIKLKEGFIHDSLSNSELIRASFPFLMSVFKYVTVLYGLPRPAGVAETLDILAGKLRFKADIFHTISRQLNDDDCGVYLFAYIQELELITLQIDQFNGA